MAEQLTASQQYEYLEQQFGRAAVEYTLAKGLSARKHAIQLVDAILDCAIGVQSDIIFEKMEAELGI